MEYPLLSSWDLGQDVLSLFLLSKLIRPIVSYFAQESIEMD